MITVRDTDRYTECTFSGKIARGQQNSGKKRQWKICVYHRQNGKRSGELTRKIVRKIMKEIAFTTLAYYCKGLLLFLGAIAFDSRPCRNGEKTSETSGGESK